VFHKSKFHSYESLFFGLFSDCVDSRKPVVYKVSQVAESLMDCIVVVLKITCAFSKRLLQNTFS